MVIYVETKYSCYRISLIASESDRRFKQSL